MTYNDITNNPRIDNVTVDKAGLGLTLYYELDGVPYNVTGEFYIDRKGIMHHTAVDANEEMIEILVKIEL